MIYRKIGRVEHNFSRRHVYRTDKRVCVVGATPHRQVFNPCKWYPGGLCWMALGYLTGRRSPLPTCGDIREYASQTSNCRKVRELLTARYGGSCRYLMICAGHRGPRWFCKECLFSPRLWGECHLKKKNCHYTFKLPCPYLYQQSGDRNLSLVPCPLVVSRGGHLCCTEVGTDTTEYF